MLTLVIDGTNLCHRARHAFNLSYGGEDTSVTYGTMRMLIALMKKHKPDAAIFCMDGGTPAFRKELYPQYKAKRHAIRDIFDDEWPIFVKQMQELENVLPMSGMLIARRKGLEADDLMAQAARMLVGDVLLISGDGDMLQCVADGVNFLKLMKKEDILYTSDNFEELVGWKPFQHAAAKTIMGDYSDNIVGVKGIGKKTAAKVLSDGPDSLSKTLKMRMNAYIESGEYNAAYTVIDLSIDMAGARYTLSQAEWKPYNRRLQAWCASKGFSSIIELGPLSRSFARLRKPRLENLLAMPRIWDYKRYPT